MSPTSKGQGEICVVSTHTNVLAAHTLRLDFCPLLDARHPDLVEAWYNIVRSIRSADLRARCKVLTWQELTECLPACLYDGRFEGVLVGKRMEDEW
jgi:hypothetical protein